MFVERHRPQRPTAGPITRFFSRAMEIPGLALGSFIGGMSSGFQYSANRWQGYEFDRMRARPPRALESVDWGLNYGRREGLLSEARSLEQTFGIARKINRSYGNHVVGSCRMKWHTGDPEIDSLYSRAWQSWMMMCDRTGRLTFPKITKSVVARTICDGRIFGQKDRRGGFLQLYMIEADRVSSDGIFNSDRPNLYSGIGVDDNGRPKFARVWERTLYGTFWKPQDIPWEQLLCVYDTDRFDVYGAPSHYHTVANAIRDLKEVTESERLSAKKLSRWGILWKTITGGAVSPPVDLFGDGSASDSPIAGASQLNVTRISDLADSYLFPGEDAKVMESNRPSEGWLKLMEHLVREIAAGLDLPFGVVWHMAGLGGPAARFEIYQANRVFMAFLKNVLEPMWFRPIVGAWLSLEIESGRLPFTPNWYHFSTPRPKSITIDLGRDSKSGIAENAAGLGTATDWYSEEDEEFEAQTDRLAYEAAYRRRAVKKYETDGVVLEDIRALGTVTTRIQQQEDDEEESEPNEPNRPARATP